MQSEETPLNRQQIALGKHRANGRNTMAANHQSSASSWLGMEYPVKRRDIMPILQEVYAAEAARRREITENSAASNAVDSNPAAPSFDELLHGPGNTATPETRNHSVPIPQQKGVERLNFLDEQRASGPDLPGNDRQTNGAAH